MKVVSIVFLLMVSPAAFAADVHECDRQAAHPSDPDRVGDGRSSSEVVTHRAIPACREAQSMYPDEARFHYQLGRAIVYWADANDGDYGEGMRHLETAAAMNYTQALFVVGLMYQREGRICDAMPGMRQAADQGLKSARITYVDHVLAGRFDDCESTAAIEEMSRWLDAAGEQVSGYYENMLLAGLKRQLMDRGE